jgi:hypothetical protein
MLTAFVGELSQRRTGQRMYRKFLVPRKKLSRE